ncbi:aminoglycoside phosphotransferase, partial [Streptomyces sp. RSD-27]
MDEARARDVLTQAGLTGPAELLAFGENAVFALGDLVVKVGREAGLLERAERELAVSGWLAAAGVPAVRAAEPGPRLVAGH